MKVQGESLTITRAPTDNAKERNTALFSAVELFKREAGVRESDIAINWDTRAVEVCKEEAFKQPKVHGICSFRNKKLA